MSKATVYFGIILLLAVVIYFSLGSNFHNSTTSDLNFGTFSMKIPRYWKKIEFDGIDSYIGGITNETDSLTFDYGWYSYNLSYENREKQLFATDTINGKIALITKPKEVGNGTLGIYIEEAYKKNRFNFLGKNILDEQIVFEIFKSIRFKDSDTTLNSKSFGFTDKITPYSGRSLFYTHCASCHHRNKNLFGPAFASINELDFKKWIIDTTNLGLTGMAKFGIRYHQKAFKKLLMDNDIEKLIEYSKVST
ncbi:cytochrome c [Tamlana sp. 2201CG12-4]|uniref:c-type cytochrome n=1 Tax=Tamlana sp. 2201CG12-4 TaxID=3112582 RepID=UPI002DBBD76C|nr:cytochrome c [Tamlana sp. 2201CG12-4]MEC3908418.1 cytochrome c [Tamlana sp. 2201CG12-4]